MSPFDPIVNSLVRKIVLNNGMKVVVDADLYRWLSLLRWQVYTSNGEQWYAKAVVPSTGKSIAMHRLIVDPPPGMVVDHWNGNGLDNRRCNLRAATHAQNAQNSRPRPGKSRFKGVTLNDDGKWVARIQTGRKTIVIGSFEFEEDAAAAYNKAALELRGDFAYLNPVAGWHRQESRRNDKRRRGRKSRPWYWAKRDGWYSTVDGRRFRLADGLANQTEAVAEFERLLAERLGTESRCATDQNKAETIVSTETVEH